MLGDYLETVREIERRMQKMEAQGHVAASTLPDAPVGMPERLRQQLNLMFDLIALAYQANMTRVVTFMMARGSQQAHLQPHRRVRRVPSAVASPERPGEDGEAGRRSRRYHTQVFAKFLDKLAAMPDGDGSLLDHSILLYGSNMSNSNTHNDDPLPSAVLGGGCGKIKGGQHLNYPQDTPLANLLLTLLERAGVPVEKLGNSTGIFSEV